MELLEPLNYLSTMLGEAWSIHSDAGLIHAYEYWVMLLDTNKCHLDLRIALEDARNGEVWPHDPRDQLCCASL